MYPEVVIKLIETFKKLPGIGQKSAERMVFFFFLNFKKDDYDMFSDSILLAKNGIKRCEICNSISDDNICNICMDKNRNKKLLVVVESFKDVFAIEKTGNFDGYYHVLGGLISPFNEIGPEDLSLDLLYDRIDKDNIDEIIFVVKSGIEADTTILYVRKLLENKKVKVTKVANGIPVGADMDYIDSLTLESALNNRKEV